MGAPQTYTLDELREETGIAAARLVRHWREGNPVDGKALRMEETDDGRQWWLEADDEDGDDEPDTGDSPALSTSPAHGRTVNALADVDIETAADVVWFLDEPSSRLEAVESLTEFSGVGAKGARQIVDWLCGLGELPFSGSIEEPEGPEQEENEPARKEKHTCEHCGDAYTHQPETMGRICKTCRRDVERVDSNGQSAYPSFVYELDPGDIHHAKRFVDQVRTDGEPGGTTSVMSDSARKAFHRWACDAVGLEIYCPHCNELHHTAPPWQYSTGDKGVHLECEACGGDFRLIEEDKGYRTRPFEESETDEQSEEHEIRCPHCNDLFDVAPLSDYEDGAADCESPDDAKRQEYGDCGKRFWLEVTDEGFETYKSDPDDSQEAGQTSAPIPRCEDCGARSESLGEDGLCDECRPKEQQLDWPDESPVTIKPKTVPQGDRVHPALTDCSFFGQAEHGTEAWHEMRRKGVGSSDAGAILGLCPHSNRSDVWASKVGEHVNEKPWLDDYAEFGSWFEEYIRGWAEQEHGTEIIGGAELGTLQSAAWPRALANIDGLDVIWGVVEEYKTTSKQWEDIPAQYHAQVQHQLFVTGCREARIRQFICPIPRDMAIPFRDDYREMATFEIEGDRRAAAFLLEHGEIVTWVVERDDEYIEQLIEAEKRFWEFVEHGIEPPTADPEGTVDLSDDPDVVSAVEGWAKAKKKKADVKPYIKAEEKAKKKAKSLLSEKVALLEDEPKRLAVGDHSLTWVQRDGYGYWNLYEGEIDEVEW